jgi:hypothetical protein
MSQISKFYGISIYIYYNEHLPPHFHAIYGEFEALINIETLAIFAGYLPPRALGLVIEWASLHHKELKKVWEQAINHQPLDKIDPLK